MDVEEQEFRRLVDEAQEVVLQGWDFSFLAGRTTTEPLPWDYLELARAAAGRAARVLDVDTGGGEVLDRHGAFDAQEAFRVLQLRAVPWQVPGFDVATFLDPLRAVHRHIRSHGRFRARNHRLLLAAWRP